MVLGPNVPFVADALQVRASSNPSAGSSTCRLLLTSAHPQAIPALQAIIVAVNTRLQPDDVSYLLENSGAAFVLVDAEFEKLVKGAKVPVVRCDDSGRAGDPYEQLLDEGAAFDRANGNLGWSGLEFQKDELATFAISYTSGTTSKPKGRSLAHPLKPETLGLTLYLLRRSRDFLPRHLPRWSSKCCREWHDRRLGLSLDLAHGQSSYSLSPSPPPKAHSAHLRQFHCLGWCYPYSNTCSMTTQICLRAVGDYSEVWRGLLERGVTHYCGAPTV